MAKFKEPMSAWDEYEAYIKSGGQNPIIRETYLVRHITALEIRIQELQTADMGSAR
jgi:hypothetical protein